ncbi:unnamed protein product [Urochloa humidicola]
MTKLAKSNTRDRLREWKPGADIYKHKNQHLEDDERLGSACIVRGEEVLDYCFIW